MSNHFGVQVHKGKRGLRLTRENYAVVSNKNSLGRFSLDIYADEDGTIYSEEWCVKQLEDSLKNFDLNMEFFSLLSRDEFNTEINKFLENNKCFVEVFDLNLYDKKSGYYLMVLDEYCQVYIGTSYDIKKRIRSHWSNSKPFDRLLFPMGAVNSSILSIDSFRALDTTRIFAYTTQDTFDFEDDFIHEFPSKFVCNRLGGGRVNWRFQVMAMMKERNLNFPLFL